MSDWVRGDRVWWNSMSARRRAGGTAPEGFPATVLRGAGRDWVTLVCLLNGSGHWYPQRARVADLASRHNYMAVDVVADKALGQLP